MFYQQVVHILVVGPHSLVVLAVEHRNLVGQGVEHTLLVVQVEHYSLAVPWMEQHLVQDMDHLLVKHYYMYKFSSSAA
jgi:hypothetical protein